MEQEIEAQGRLLSAHADRYLSELTSLLQDESFDIVLLAARGSSDNAALFARYLIEVWLGVPVVLAAPSVWTKMGATVRYPKCLAVGISQSGAAPDVSDVLDIMGRAGHTTLAITNTPDSRLAQTARHCLLLGVGEEHSVAATKTFTATLLALYQVVRVFKPQLPFAQLPDDHWIEQVRAWADDGAGTIVRSSPVFALGRGYGFSVANESALKLMECALIPCKSYSVADFEHGPKALAGHGSAAITYGVDASNLADQGCTILVTPTPPIDPNAPIRAIWDVIAGQWLALFAARARGLDPDRPPHIRKVTLTH
jgi:glucosamine--fructose-6-phosphate aminotransferase (isomerizing)